MADSTGLNAATGAPLTDWAHVQQSIRRILTTRIGTRVMRRDFGSDIPDMVDRKMTPQNVLLVYSSAAVAIEKWEPRFRMLAGSVDELNAAGQVVMDIYGLYYPHGHLGDYSVAETASSKIIFERNG